MSMLKEFREFAVKGNAVDLAVGIIIGAAFGKIVSSLVEDVIMPPIGYVLGGVDFSGLFLALNGESYPSLSAAKDAGAPRSSAMAPSPTPSSTSLLSLSRSSCW